MGRPKRADDGGLLYHVLNRANAQMTIFEHDGDYEAFEQVLEEAVARTGTRLLAYCVMPNHWHLIVWPRQDGELSRFVGWLTLTHTQRWHAQRHTRGSGHVYQGRFKSFPVQGNEHFLTASRYVERNALRANLVERAEDWRWCSLYRRVRSKAGGASWLSAWPLERPRRWVKLVNTAQRETELAALRRSVQRGCPFGEALWSDQMVRRLGLEMTIRPHGRPRKQDSDS
ncbi:MAG: transposase [Isosphaeraceae bacterium]